MPISRPADAAQGGLGGVREVPPLEEDPSRLDARDRRQQAQHGAADHRLAAAGLAHQRHHLARIHREGNVVDHALRRLVRLAHANAEPFDGERGGHRFFIRGSNWFAQRVAEEVDAEERHRDADPGDERQPRRLRHVVAAVREHAAPARRRRRHAEAQERERALGEQRPAEERGGEHDDRAEAVGQHVAEHGEDLGIAHDARGLDVLALADRQHAAAHHAATDGM
jgi:hypothetical protein